MSHPDDAGGGDDVDDDDFELDWHLPWLHLTYTSHPDPFQQWLDLEIQIVSVLTWIDQLMNSGIMQLMGLGGGIMARCIALMGAGW